jgi:hypothetical protein
MTVSRGKVFLFFVVLLLIPVLSPQKSFASYGSEAMLEKDDEAFLDSIQRQAFEYFLKEYNPDTGLYYDGSTHTMGASIAATGFALSALCVGESRGWITRKEAYDRVLTTLKTFHRDRLDPNDFYAEGYYGLFFHFLDPETGRWFKNSDCVSTADTADLMAGVITCMEYFKGTEVERIGDAIVRACEWNKFLYDNNGRAHPFMAMGYIPPDQSSSWNDEKGFFGKYFGYRDNSFLINLFAIASPLHPIPVDAWYMCQATYVRQAYNNKKVIVTSPPGIAFHYYHHLWLDLRNKKDQAADYFRNSIMAVQAQQEYCATSGNYEDGLWGISSCLSLRGYEALGAPFGRVYDNGTITPHAIAGGMVFTPRESLEAMKGMVARYDGAVMGKYGLTDAFNQKRGWVSREYLGIDQGVIVLGIENFRTGLVWKYFTRNRYIQDALERIGFTGIVEDFESDLSREEYSSYDIASRNASCFVVGNIYAEGARSLKINPRDRKDVVVAIKPALKDFSPYRFLSVWARNADDMEAELKDSEGNCASFTHSEVIESAGWTRFYFELANDEGPALDRIEEVVLTLKPPGAKGSWSEPFYLDGVLLTYGHPCVNPPPVRYLSISAVKDFAVCRVNCERVPDVHSYDIRYSTRPIRGQADFEKLRSPDAPYLASGRADEEFYVPLPMREKYYIAVQALDRHGQRSEPVSVGPIMVDSAASHMILDDFEGPGGFFSPVEWPAHKGYDLDVTKECASQGGRALKVEYDKKRGGEWTYVELNFKKPIDVRPFRYLKVDALGSDNVMAKLYTTLKWQEEAGTLIPMRPDQWNELAFDLSAMPGQTIDKSRISKVIFFIAPGRIASGTMYFDNIRLDNASRDLKGDEEN